MTIGELSFVVLLFGVPLWLTLKVWRKYLTVTRAAFEDLFQIRIGLTMITLSTAMWLAALVLMFLSDYSVEAKSLAINLSPAVLGLTNLLLCAIGLICSASRSRSVRETAPLRRAMGASSGCLMLMWLFLLANPH